MHGSPLQGIEREAKRERERERERLREPVRCERKDRRRVRPWKALFVLWSLVCRSQLTIDLAAI